MILLKKLLSYLYFIFCFNSFASEQRNPFEDASYDSKRIYTQNRLKLSWDTRFTHLSDWRALNPKLKNVPTKYSTSEHPNLGRWFHAQLVLWREGKLIEDRIEMLKSLGFKMYIRKPYKRKKLKEKHVRAEERRERERERERERQQEAEEFFKTLFS
jgi:hypothetical protein